jgi:hypothetical protein
MKIKLLFALLLTMPFSAFAGPVGDLSLMCDISPKDFFSYLVSNGMIVTKPVQVRDGMSVFRPPLFKKIRVQNMRVVMFSGNVAGQIMFTPNGPTPNAEFYGFVVDEGIANVQAVLTSLGSPAKTHLINHNQTEIICPGA